MTSLKTREQARREISRKGISIAEWARQNNVNQPMVYQVLGGKKFGKWGEAHRVAVLLGMKEGQV